MNKHAFTALAGLTVATVFTRLSHGGTTGFEDFMAIYLIAALIAQVYMLSKSD